MVNSYLSKLSDLELKSLQVKYKTEVTLKGTSQLALKCKILHLYAVTHIE